MITKILTIAIPLGAAILSPLYVLAELFVEVAK